MENVNVKDYLGPKKDLVDPEDDSKIKVYRKIEGHGKQQPKHMRHLPEDLIATDSADPDRVHIDDAPHTIAELEDQYWEKQLGQKKAKSLAEALGMERAPIGKKVPLNQKHIDIEIMICILNKIKSDASKAARGEQIYGGMCHLLFAKDNVNEYRFVNKPLPPRYMLPKHMRRFDCEVNIWKPPQRCVDLLHAAGLDMWTELRREKRKVEDAVQEAAIGEDEDWQAVGE